MLQLIWSFFGGDDVPDDTPDADINADTGIHFQFFSIKNLITIAGSDAERREREAEALKKAIAAEKVQSAKALRGSCAPSVNVHRRMRTLW